MQRGHLCKSSYFDLIIYLRTAFHTYVNFDSPDICSLSKSVLIQHILIVAAKYDPLERATGVSIQTSVILTWYYWYMIFCWVWLHTVGHRSYKFPFLGYLLSSFWYIISPCRYMTSIIIPRGSIEGFSTKDLMHCLGACHFQSPRAGQLNWYVPVKKNQQRKGAVLWRGLNSP